MASLQSSSSLISSLNKINATMSVPKLPKFTFTVPKIPNRSLNLVDGVNLLGNGIPIHTITPIQEKTHSQSSDTIKQLYAILEAVSDRIEMHHNIGEQRDNWNTLLLNSINLITLTATTMVGVGAMSSMDGPAMAFKLSTTGLFLAATGMLVIMNKIQPSQLVEEQRNATRLFKQIKCEIETMIAVGSPTKHDVKHAMDRVLALDKAYPLPLLGSMLEKFPQTFKPASWWPNKNAEVITNSANSLEKMNGWNDKLETELKEVIKVIKSKDVEDYERLGKIALKVNKTLAIAGPVLTGIATLGSAFVDSSNGSSWAPIVAMTGGALATIVNTMEHGGQVGMVFEMYRNTAGFFNLLEESIESNLNESDYEKRENGEMFEMKVALKLGRSLSQLRDLTKRSSSFCADEFASKLF